MKAQTQMEAKERPILFSGPMVRAILDRRKTQTRRVVKLPERLIALSEKPVDIDMCANVSGHWSAYDRGNNPSKAWEMIKCPYGKPGDRLWVRETWRTHEMYNELSPLDFPMSAGAFFKVADDRKAEIDTHPFGRWRPSIFMPRWASRITLEITSVRVERLRELSESDAEAEGVAFCTDAMDFGKTVGGYLHNHVQGGSYFAAFIKLWNKINGKKHPWESNPWVWVLQFQKLS